MRSRREFIQGSLTAAMGMLAAPAVPAFAAVAEPSIHLYKIVFDERFAAGRLFGAEAGRQGANVYAVRGDVTDLWYRDLHARWRRSPAPIAGMTRYSSLFALAMMAGDAGLRVIYRGHHRRQPDGTVTHEVFGPQAARRHASELRGSEEEWSRTAATIIMNWPADMRMISRAASNIAEADQKLIGPETLISWIIAPALRG